MNAPILIKLHSRKAFTVKISLHFQKYRKPFLKHRKETDLNLENDFVSILLGRTDECFGNQVERCPPPMASEAVSAPEGAPFNQSIKLR